ncbi:hypothetical protein ABH940_007385, partial [Streptacidiphilus sp. BW17]|uniref:polymorphic toxin-type HINT domain-containing protein n=1 Tax=Streptacidiphilus sp. BW17 TaxID=3156274 RepID=UPI003512D0E1
PSTASPATTANASRRTDSHRHPATHKDQDTPALTNAADLHLGDHLREPSGAVATVAKVRNYTSHIVTYNLTVAEVHTYYVFAGTTPILVHNSCPPMDLDAALQSGAQADRGGYSFAGRALAKHAGRNGNPNGWPIPSGVQNPAAWNATGQEMLDNILKNQGSTFTQGYGRIGGQWQDTIDVRLPSGLGARFSLTGQFSGFLD